MGTPSFHGNLLPRRFGPDIPFQALTGALIEAVLLPIHELQMRLRYHDRAAELRKKRCRFFYPRKPN